MDNLKYQEIASRDWPQVAIGQLRAPVVAWADRGANGAANAGERLLQEHAQVLEGTPLCREREPGTPAMSGTVERYGGTGIGANGGGARCINYEAGDPTSAPDGTRRMFQAKGTGQNPVVGQHDDREHSYGGLDARKAIVETIYTHVLGSVLPLGTVKIFGLVFTGHDTAYNGIGDCWGVTMIRDQCLRPAHFMKAGGFKPTVEFAKAQPGELARMRRLYKRIHAESENSQAFIRYLGQYLRNAANQFSFARAARITHGTLSPSNLAMDGRWLDLPVASFLSGGVNYNISSIFYAEGAEPLGYALEIIHNYAKFNGLKLSPSILSRYYAESFEAYFKVHLAFVFGVPVREDRAGPLLENPSLVHLARMLGGIINRDRKIRMERPARDSADPVVAFVSGCHASLRGLAVAKGCFATAGIDPGEIPAIAAHFRALVDEYARILCIEQHDAATAELGFLLVALKRGLLASAFYLPVVDDEVKRLCAEGSPDDIGALIDDYIEASAWIFEEASGEITLFKGRDLAISYCGGSGYRVRAGGVQSAFPDYPALHAYVGTLDRARLTIRGFDYSFFFDELARVVPMYEAAAPATVPPLAEAMAGAA
jgi:hypothetical protein